MRFEYQSLSRLYSNLPVIIWITIERHIWKKKRIERKSREMESFRQKKCFILKQLDYLDIHKDDHSICLVLSYVHH